MQDKSRLFWLPLIGSILFFNVMQAQDPEVTPRNIFRISAGTNWAATVLTMGEKVEFLFICDASNIQTEQNINIGFSSDAPQGYYIERFNKRIFPPFSHNALCVLSTDLELWFNTKLTVTELKAVLNKPVNPGKPGKRKVKELVFELTGLDKENK